MAIATFNPPINPTPGTTFKPKVELWEAPFGDGYAQATPRGLNHVAETITLKWGGLTFAQMDSIRLFFETQKGMTPFYFTPRGRLQPVKWTCREWSYSDASPWTFEAQLVQWFGPEG